MNLLSFSERHYFIFLTYILEALFQKLPSVFNRVSNCSARVLAEHDVKPTCPSCGNKMA